MSAGFPIRPTSAQIGPELANVAPVRNPETDLDAVAWNLLKHQVAGCGLMVPRVLFKVTIDDPLVLVARAEAWNPNGLTTGVYAAPTLNYVSTGRGTVEYATPLPDQKGDNQIVAFSWAMGWLSADPPTTVKKVQVEPVAATPARLTICVFDASNALEDGNTVWVAAG